jgi:hypothetical protein
MDRTDRIAPENRGISDWIAAISLLTVGNIAALKSQLIMGEFDWLFSTQNRLPPR